MILILVSVDFIGKSLLYVEEFDGHHLKIYRAILSNETNKNEDKKKKSPFQLPKAFIFNLNFDHMEVHTFQHILIFTPLKMS